MSALHPKTPGDWPVRTLPAHVWVAMVYDRAVLRTEMRRPVETTR